MQKNRVRNTRLQSLHVKNIIGVVGSPALESLTFGDRVHNHSDEISSVAAVIQDARRQLVGIQSSSPKTLAAHPRREKFLAIAAMFHGTKPWNQRLKNGQRTAVNGKTACRQQHVIEQVRSRTVAAHHKDRTTLAVVGGL